MHDPDLVEYDATKFCSVSVTDKNLIGRLKKANKQNKSACKLISTMAVRVRYKSWYISLSSFARQQRELLYLPTQIRFPIGGQCVTCSGSILTNSLGRTKLSNFPGKQHLSTRTWTGCAPCNPGKFICQPVLSKRFFSLLFFPFFELGGITEHLMTGPAGNSEFCFPPTSMFSSASRQGTERVSGIQKSLFPLGASH